MDSTDIQRKFDNVWEELKLMRKFAWKIVAVLILGAFAVGGATVEMRMAVAENDRNQRELADGINYAGECLRIIADELNIKHLPDRPIVHIEEDN